MRVAHVVGTRPQFIKYAPVSRAIHRINEMSDSPMENILIHTGQHYDYALSAIFFRELGIHNPEYHLGVGSGTHGVQTGLILQKVEEVLSRERPDVIVVYGDTNSTLGAALAAVKMHIPVAHVEAGLRSFNKNMPEEINRVLTDHASTVLFCPTEAAVHNLRGEGFAQAVNDEKAISGRLQLDGYEPGPSNPVVVNVGDVMYDLMLLAVGTAKGKSTVLEDHGLAGNKYYVLTLHRAENTDDDRRIERVAAFINEVAAGTPVIFPVHPRTRKALAQIGGQFAGNVKMIEPLGYFDMAWLVANSALVLTDSGGLQKEAYWLRVPCITLREETEWVETVKSGWNVLCRDYEGSHRPSSNYEPFYGDGRSAEKIIRILNDVFKKERT